MCKHYWKIADAVGLESKGTCQGCGESKMFPNYYWQSAYRPYDPEYEILDKMEKAKRIGTKPKVGWHYGY